jgi:hypothetical protein
MGKSVTRTFADAKEAKGRIFTISRGICAESGGGFGVVLESKNGH